MCTPAVSYPLSAKETVSVACIHLTVPIEGLWVPNTAPIAFSLTSTIMTLMSIGSIRNALPPKEAFSKKKKFFFVRFLFVYLFPTQTNCSAVPLENCALIKIRAMASP